METMFHSPATTPKFDDAQIIAALYKRSSFIYFTQKESGLNPYGMKC